MQENDPHILASSPSQSTHSQRNPTASKRRGTPSRITRTRESPRKKCQVGSLCELRGVKPPPPSILARSSSVGYCSKSTAKSSEFTPAYEEGTRGLASHFADSLLKHAESYEAVEIRYIDNDKCTIVRPRPGDSCGQLVLRTSQYPISGWNSKPDGVVRKQKVCVEKVHIKNLLHTKRERCGNLSSSRSSEYVPSDEAPRSDVTTAATIPTEPTTQGWPRNDRYFHHQVENLGLEPELTTARVGEKYEDVSGDWCRKLVSAPKRREQAGNYPAGSVSRSVYSRRASKDMLDYIKHRTKEASGEDVCDNYENDDAELEEREKVRDEVGREGSDEEAEVSSCISLCDDPKAGTVMDKRRQSYARYGRDSAGLTSSGNKEDKENHYPSSGLEKFPGSDEISTEKSRASQSGDTVSGSPVFNVSEEQTNRNSMGERRRKCYTANTGIDRDLSQLNHYHVAPEANTTISITPFPRPIINPECQVKTTRLADWSMSDIEQKKPAATFQLYNAHTGRSFPCLSDTGMNLNEPSTSISSSGGKIVNDGPTTHSAETQSTEWLPSEPAPKNSPYALMPEETIAEYKQIALQILMERKQRAIDKSLIHKSACTQKDLETPDRNVTKKRRTGRGSHKALKVHSRDSAAVEAPPRSASRSSQKTSFWASSRIKNEIEKHCNRLRTGDGNKALSCSLRRDNMLTQRLKKYEKKCAHKEDGFAFQDKRSDNITEAKHDIKHVKNFTKVESKQPVQRSAPHSNARFGELFIKAQGRTSDECTDQTQRARLPNVKKCKKPEAIQNTDGRPSNTIWHPGARPEVVQFINTVSLTEATGSEVNHLQLAINTQSLTPNKTSQGLLARAIPTHNETCETALFGIRKPAGDKKQPTAVMECFHAEHNQLLPPTNAIENRLPGSGIAPRREVVPLPSSKNSTRGSETHLKFGVKSGSRPLLPRVFSSERGNSPSGIIDSTTKDIGRVANTTGDENVTRGPQNPSSYLELFQNVLKSPTAKAAQALGTFLQNPEAALEVNEENYMTVDEIINSYRKIVQQLSAAPPVEHQGNTSLKPTFKSSPKVDKTEFRGSRSQMRLQDGRLCFHRSPLARVSPPSARHTKPLKNAVSKIKRGQVKSPGMSSKGINNSFSDSNASELPSVSTGTKAMSRKTNKSRKTSSEISAIRHTKAIHKTRSPSARSSPYLDFTRSPVRKPVSKFYWSGKSDQTDTRSQSSPADERKCKVNLDNSDYPNKATGSRDGPVGVSLKSEVESPARNKLLFSENQVKFRQSSSKTSPNSSGTPPRPSSLCSGPLNKKSLTETRVRPDCTQLLKRGLGMDLSDFESKAECNRTSRESPNMNCQQPPHKLASDGNIGEDYVLEFKESLWGLESPECLSDQQQAWTQPCSGILNVGTAPTSESAPLQYSLTPISITGQNLSSTADQWLVHNECKSSIKTQAMMASNTHTKVITSGHSQETLHRKSRGNDINTAACGELGHRRSISTTSLQFGAQLAQLEAYHKASSTLFSSGAIGISKTYPAITIFAPQACLNILSSSPTDSRPRRDAPEASIGSPVVKKDNFSEMQPELQKTGATVEQPELQKTGATVEKCTSKMMDLDKKLRGEEDETADGIALPRLDQKLQLKPINKSSSVQLMTSHHRHMTGSLSGTASFTEGVQKLVQKNHSVSPNSRSLSGGPSLHKIANYEKQTTSSLLRNERTAMKGSVLSSSTDRQRRTATKGACARQITSLPKRGAATSHYTAHRNAGGSLASLRMSDVSTPRLNSKNLVEHRPVKYKEFTKHALKCQKSAVNIGGFLSRTFHQISPPDRMSYPACQETLVAGSKSSLSWSKQHLARSQEVKDKHHVSSVALKAFLDNPFCSLQRSSDEVNTAKKRTAPLNWRSQSTERAELGHRTVRHPPHVCSSDQLSKQAGAKAESRQVEACGLKGDGQAETIKSSFVSAPESVHDSVRFEPQPTAATKKLYQKSPRNQRKPGTGSGACPTVEPNPLLISVAHEKNTENQTILTSKSQLTEDDSDMSDVSSLTAVRKNIVASTCRMILRESKNLLVSNLKKRENPDQSLVKSAAKIGFDDQHVGSISQDGIDPSLISEAACEIKKSESPQDRASQSGIYIGGTTSFSAVASSVAVSVVRGPSSGLAGKLGDAGTTPLAVKRGVSRVNETSIAMSSSNGYAGEADEQKTLECSLMGVPTTDDMVTAVSVAEPTLAVSFRQSKHLTKAKHTPKLQTEETMPGDNWRFNRSLSEKMNSRGGCDTPEAFEHGVILRSEDKQSHSKSRPTQTKDIPMTSNASQHQFSTHKSQANNMDNVCRSSPLSGLELQTQLDHLCDYSDKTGLRTDQPKYSHSSEICKQADYVPRSLTGGEVIRSNEVDLFVQLDQKIEISEKDMSREKSLKFEQRINSLEDHEGQQKIAERCVRKNPQICPALFELSTSEQLKDEFKTEFKEGDRQLRGVAGGTSEKTEVSNAIEGSAGSIRQRHVDFEHKINEAVSLSRNLTNGEDVNPEGNSCKAALVDKRDMLRDSDCTDDPIDPRLEKSSSVEVKKDKQTLASHYEDIFAFFGAKLIPQPSESLKDGGKSKRQEDESKDYQAVLNSSGTGRSHTQEWSSTHIHCVNTDQDSPSGLRITPTEITIDSELSNDTATLFNFHEPKRLNQEKKLEALMEESERSIKRFNVHGSDELDCSNKNFNPDQTPLYESPVTASYKQSSYESSLLEPRGFLTSPTNTTRFGDEHRGLGGNMAGNEACQSLTAGDEGHLLVLKKPPLAQISGLPVVIKSSPIVETSAYFSEQPGRNELESHENVEEDFSQTPRHILSTKNEIAANQKQQPETLREPCLSKNERSGSYPSVSCPNSRLFGTRTEDPGNIETTPGQHFQNSANLTTYYQEQTILPEMITSKKYEETTTSNTHLKHVAIGDRAVLPLLDMTAEREEVNTRILWYERYLQAQQELLEPAPIRIQAMVNSEEVSGACREDRSQEMLRGSTHVIPGEKIQVYNQWTTAQQTRNLPIDSAFVLNTSNEVSEEYQGSSQWKVPAQKFSDSVVESFVPVGHNHLESVSAAPELTGDSKITALATIEAKRNISTTDSDHRENWLKQKNDKDTAHVPCQILIGNYTGPVMARRNAEPPVEGSSLDDPKVKITTVCLPTASVTNCGEKRDDHLEKVKLPPLNLIPCNSVQLSGKSRDHITATIGATDNEITLTSSQYAGSKQENQADLSALGTDVQRPSSSSGTVTSRSTDFMCSSHSCSCCSLSSGQRSSWDSRSAHRDPGLNQVCSKTELSSPDYGHLLLIPVLCTWSTQQQDGTSCISGVLPSAPTEDSGGSRVFVKAKLIQEQPGSVSCPDRILSYGGDCSMQDDYFERDFQAMTECGSINNVEKCTGSPHIVSGMGFRSGGDGAVHESLYISTELLPGVEENVDRFKQPQYSSTVKGTSEQKCQENENDDSSQKSVNENLFQRQRIQIGDGQHEENEGERIVESLAETRLNLRHSSVSNGDRVAVSKLHHGASETPGVYVSELGQDQIDENVPTQEEKITEECEKSRHTRGVEVTNVLIRITSIPGGDLSRQHAPRKIVQTTITNDRSGRRKSHERAPQQTLDLATYQETAQIKVNLGSAANERYTHSARKGEARLKQCKHNSHPETRISRKPDEAEKLETVNETKHSLSSYALLDSHKIQNRSIADTDKKCFKTWDFVPDKLGECQQVSSKKLSRKKCVCLSPHHSPRFRLRRTTPSSPEYAQADPSSVRSPLSRMCQDSHRDDHLWICSSPKKSSRTKLSHEMSTQTFLNQTDFQGHTMDIFTKALKPKVHVSILRDSCTGTSETTLLLESAHIPAEGAGNSVRGETIVQGEISSEVAQTTSVKSTVALSSSADSSMSPEKHKNVNIEQKVFDNLDMFMKSTRQNSTSVTETAVSFSSPVNPFTQDLFPEKDVSTTQKTTSPFNLTSVRTLKKDVERNHKCTSTLSEGMSLNLASRPAIKFTLRAHVSGGDATQQITIKQMATQVDDLDTMSSLVPFSEHMNDTWSQCSARNHFENTGAGAISFQNLNTDTTDTAPQSQVYDTTEVCWGQYESEQDVMKVTGLLTSTSAEHGHSEMEKILSDKGVPWLELYDSARLLVKSNQETLQDVWPLPTEQDSLHLQPSRDISQQINNLSVLQSLPLPSTLTRGQQLLDGFDDGKCGMWREPHPERRTMSAASFTASYLQPKPTTIYNPFLCSAPAKLATAPATERSFLAAFDPLVSPEVAQTTEGNIGDDCSIRAVSNNVKLNPKCCRDKLHRSSSPTEIDEFASFLSERLSIKHTENINEIELTNCSGGINAMAHHGEDNLILFSDRSQTDEDQVVSSHNEHNSSHSAWGVPKLGSWQTLVKLDSSEVAENKISVDGVILMSRKEVNLCHWPVQHSEAAPRDEISGIPYFSKTVDYCKYSGQHITTSNDVMTCCPVAFKGGDIMVSDDTAVVSGGHAPSTPFNFPASESKSETRSRTASSMSLLIRREAIDEKIEREIAGRYFMREMLDTDNFGTDSSSKERCLSMKDPTFRQFHAGQESSSLLKDETTDIDQMLETVTTLTSQFFHIVKGLKKRLRPSEQRRLRSKLRWARLFSRSRHNYGRLSNRSRTRRRRPGKRRPIAMKKTNYKPGQIALCYSGNVTNKSSPSTYSLNSFRFSSTKRLVTETSCVKSSSTTTKEKQDLFSFSNTQLSPFSSSSSTEQTEGRSSSTQLYNKYKPLRPCSSTSVSLRAPSSFSSKDNRSYPEDTLEVVRDSHTFSTLETPSMEAAGEQDIPRYGPLDSQELPRMYEHWCDEDTHDSVDDYYQNYFFPSFAPVYVDVNSGAYGLGGLPLTLISALLGYIEPEFGDCEVEESKDTPKVVLLDEKDEVEGANLVKGTANWPRALGRSYVKIQEIVEVSSDNGDEGQGIDYLVTDLTNGEKVHPRALPCEAEHADDMICNNQVELYRGEVKNRSESVPCAKYGGGVRIRNVQFSSDTLISRPERVRLRKSFEVKPESTHGDRNFIKQLGVNERLAKEARFLDPDRGSTIVKLRSSDQVFAESVCTQRGSSRSDSSLSLLARDVDRHSRSRFTSSHGNYFIKDDMSSPPKRPKAERSGKLSTPFPRESRRGNRDETRAESVYLIKDKKKDKGKKRYVHKDEGKGKKRRIFKSSPRQLGKKAVTNSFRGREHLGRAFVQTTLISEWVPELRDKIERSSYSSLEVKEAELELSVLEDCEPDTYDELGSLCSEMPDSSSKLYKVDALAANLCDTVTGGRVGTDTTGYCLDGQLHQFRTSASTSAIRTTFQSRDFASCTPYMTWTEGDEGEVFTGVVSSGQDGYNMECVKLDCEETDDKLSNAEIFNFNLLFSRSAPVKRTCCTQTDWDNMGKSSLENVGEGRLTLAEIKKIMGRCIKSKHFKYFVQHIVDERVKDALRPTYQGGSAATKTVFNSDQTLSARCTQAASQTIPPAGRRTRVGASSKQIVLPNGSVNYQDAGLMQESPRERLSPKLHFSQASSWNHSPRRNSGSKKSRQDLSWPQSWLGSHAGVSGLEASRQTTFAASNCSAVPGVHTRIKAPEADRSVLGVQLVATQTPASNNNSSYEDEDGLCSSPPGMEGAREHHTTVEQSQEDASLCIMESPRILLQQHIREEQALAQSEDRSEPSRKQTKEETRLKLEVTSGEAGRVSNRDGVGKGVEDLPSVSRKMCDVNNAKFDSKDSSHVQVGELSEKDASGNGLQRDAGTQVNDEVGESVTPDFSSTSSMKIDYGRLKHVLSAETKTLWKNLTRLEQTCDRCKRCRKQYDSIVGTTKVKGDKPEVAASLQTSDEVMWTSENVNNAQCSNSCKLSAHPHSSTRASTPHDNCTTSQKLKFKNDENVANKLSGSNTKHSEREKVRSATIFQRSTTDSHHTSPTQAKPLQMSSSVKAQISKFSTQTASPKPCEAGGSARPNLIKRSNTAKIIQMFERRKSISQDDMECLDHRRSSQRQVLSSEDNVAIRCDYDSSTSERVRSLTYSVSPEILVGEKKINPSLNRIEPAIPPIDRHEGSNNEQMLEDVHKTKATADHKRLSVRQSPESSFRNNIPSSADLSNAKQILAMNAPSSVTDEWIQILANILSEMQKTFPQFSKTSAKGQDDPSACSSVSRSVEDASPFSTKATNRQHENCDRQNDDSRHRNCKNLTLKDAKKKSPTNGAVYPRVYHDREEERTWTVSSTSGDIDCRQQRPQAKEKHPDVKETNDGVFTVEARNVGECEVAERDKNRESDALGYEATVGDNMSNGDSRRTLGRDVHPDDDTSCSLLPKTSEDRSQSGRSNTSKLADLSSFDDCMNENNQAIGSATSVLISSKCKTSDVHSIGVKTPPGVMNRLELNQRGFLSQAAGTLSSLSDCPPLATSSKKDLTRIDSADKPRRLLVSAEKVELLVSKQSRRNQVSTMNKKSKTPRISSINTSDVYFRKSSSTSNLSTALFSKPKTYDELSKDPYSNFTKQPSESFILENRKYQGRNPAPFPGKNQNKALTCRKRSPNCDDCAHSLKPLDHTGKGPGTLKIEVVSEDDTCERVTELPLETGGQNLPLDACQDDLPDESSAEGYRTDFGWQGDSVRLGWMSSSLTNAECRSDKFNALAWQNESRKGNREEADKMPDFEFIYSTSDQDEMYSFTRSFPSNRQQACLARQPLSQSTDDSRVLEPSPIPILSENQGCFEESLELTMGTMNDVKDMSFLSNDKDYYEEKSARTNQRTLARPALSASVVSGNQSKVANLTVDNLNPGGRNVSESEQALSDHDETSEISFSLVRAVSQGKLWYDCKRFDEKRQKRSKLSRRHSGQEFHRTASRNQNCSSDSVSCPPEQNQTGLSLTVVSWPELVSGETKSSYTDRTLTRRNTWSTPEQRCMPNEKSNRNDMPSVPLEVVHIPVDIYTVPAHKFASPQKKKKKKTDVPTRTVAISGPVQNLSIAVQRHPTRSADGARQAGSSFPRGSRQRLARETLARPLSPQARRPGEEDRKGSDSGGQEERKGTTSWMHSVKKILPFGRRAVSSDRD